MFKILFSFSGVLGRSTKNRYISYNRALLRESYSTEDRTYILKRLNERNIPSKSIGESHANKILAYVEKNKVVSLEDLLQVSGIGPKLLRKICDKILSETNGGEVPIVAKKRQEFHVIPALDEAKRKGRSTKNRYISYNRALLRESYSTEDRTYILKRLNERNIPSKSIGESHANKILAYVEKNKVVSLEDLLQVSGIGPKLLRKICDKILSETNGGEVPIVAKKRQEFHVIPALDEAKRKVLNCVVGVQVGHENVAWALVDTRTKEVLEWKYTENSCEAENLFTTLQMVERIKNLVPTADLYLFEDNGIGRQRPDYCRGYLTAMLITSFQSLRGTSLDDPVITIVKKSLKNKLYNASVGSESVSIQRYVVEMMEKQSDTADSAHIPMDLTKFLSLRAATREDMAQALLLATAYIKIFIDILKHDDPHQQQSGI